MKRLTLLLGLLALPLSAAVTNNGDGTSTLTAKGANRFVVGVCEYVTQGAWSEGRMPCAGQIGADGVYLRTFVQVGICTQSQADAGAFAATLTFPANVGDCSAALQAAGLCLPEWAGMTIPNPTKCAIFLDHWNKYQLANQGKLGMALIEVRRIPAPADDSGDFGDP